MNVSIEGVLKKNHPNNWLAWFCLSGKEIYIPFSQIFSVQDNTEAFDDRAFSKSLFLPRVCIGVCPKIAHLPHLAPSHAAPREMWSDLNLLLLRML